MSRPMWVVSLIKRGFPHRFLGAKLTRVPVLGRVAERMLFEGDGLVVLPPERLVSVGEQVQGGGSAMLPSAAVERFIEKAGFAWIMNSCICREASGCEDYPEDLGCLFLGEAARDINPALGRPATREEALEHLQRARDAGLFHVIGRNKLDSVWLKVGPGDKLLTICNCCPCCCLWRILPDVSGSISGTMERLPGLSVTVSEKCTGCGKCAEGPCLAGAISIEGDRAVIGEECRGCGHCAAVCPESAIEISLPDDGYVEDLVERLSRLVDVT